MHICAIADLVGASTRQRPVGQCDNHHLSLPVCGPITGVVCCDTGSYTLPDIQRIMVPLTDPLKCLIIPDKTSLNSVSGAPGVVEKRKSDLRVELDDSH